MELVKPTTTSSCYEYNRFYYLKNKVKKGFDLTKDINEKTYVSGTDHPHYKSDRTSYAQKCYDKNRDKYLKKSAERVNCPYCNKDFRRSYKSKHIKICKSKPED